MKKLKLVLCVMMTIAWSIIYFNVMTAELTGALGVLIKFAAWVPLVFIGGTFGGLIADYKFSIQKQLGIGLYK